MGTDFKHEPHARLKKSSLALQKVVASEEQRRRDQTAQGQDSHSVKYSHNQAVNNTFDGGKNVQSERMLDRVGQDSTLRASRRAPHKRNHRDERFKDSRTDAS